LVVHDLNVPGLVMATRSTGANLLKGGQLPRNQPFEAKTFGSFIVEKSLQRSPSFEATYAQYLA
jgi:hypothetical protein